MHFQLQRENELFGQKLFCNWVISVRILGIVAKWLIWSYQCAMTFALPTDPTLDEVRLAMAPLLPVHAAFDGWNDKAVHAAAADLGVDGDIALLAFKSGKTSGAMALIDAWLDSIDAEMGRALPPATLEAMKIRQRITALVATRLAIMAPHKEALRRAMAIMAMPTNAIGTARMGWRTADRMWRLAGDTASDFNHYTKRMTLSAVYASCLIVFINDDTDDFADTHAFLDRRIENVMQFEKIKAQAKARQEYMPSLSRFVGRLRYPPR
jgi:ubiquinone biosynthesis protein COQ9